jgi:hypothetical protein
VRVTAAAWKIRIEQGAAFRLGIRILDENGQPVTLDGYTARLQIREYTEAPDPPLADWSTEGDNPVISIDETGQRFAFFVSGATTGAYPWRHGVFDMLVTDPDGNPDRLLRGEAEVDLAVTR